MSAHTEPFSGGAITLEYEPVSGGKIRLAARADGETLESGEYNRKIFGSQTLRGQFLNSVTASLDGHEDIDADAVRTELNQWFASMHELDREEQRERFLRPEIKQLLDGTQSVEVHGGETTTWIVTLRFAGRTRELEFTAGDMVADSGGALQQKIANEFYEVIDIDGADWEAIRERWREEQEVVAVVETTGREAVADRLLEYLGDGLMAVDERGKMANDPAACWYDETNATGSDAVPPDAPVVWVQDRFLVDQLDRVGKKPESKAEVIKTLNRRGDIHGVESDGRKKWGWDRRTKVYPFTPEALGLGPDDVGGGAEPAHSEVDA